ncbi:MAG TPA: CrcB family protein [Candidatus Acidoferrum sp.]|nr:CrcB family protein [Candidatus Acidoferrum sp.]
MLNYLFVAIGGAIGACSRFAVYNLGAFLGVASQVATLAINIAGALVIGVLYVVIIETGRLQPYGQQLLTIGFLGAFTTYSSYSLDALRLLEQGNVVTAIGYLLGTMVLCLLATWLGVSLTRIFIV